MKEKLPQKQYNSYLKYSGIGLQLMALVCLMTYGGFWLDTYFQNQKPVFSIVLATVSVILGMVYVAKQLLKGK